MVTAKRTSKKAPAKARGRAKPKFSTKELDSLMKKIHKNPELLDGDWRDLVRDNFFVSEEDEKGLRGTPARKVKKIQNFLSELSAHIKGGGKITGKLTKRSADEQKKTGLTYDIDVDYAASKRAATKKG